MHISDEQWAFFEEEGYLRLGSVADEDLLSDLRSRAEDIMLGHADLDYDLIMMQRSDKSSELDDLGELSPGWKGSTLAYKEIRAVENDPLLLEFMESQMFRDLCERVYGYATPVACFHAAILNPPESTPWRQWVWGTLDRPPIATVWTALDELSEAKGCLQILPKSHLFGMLNQPRREGEVSEEQVDGALGTTKPLSIGLEPGEGILLHNWTIHRTSFSTEDTGPRILSVGYIEAETRSEDDEEFFQLFEHTYTGGW